MSSASDSQTGNTPAQNGSLSAGQPQREPSSTEDKQHRLTAPTPLSDADVREHLELALSAVESQRRVAVFNPDNTTVEQPIVVTNDSSTEAFSLQRLESGLPDDTQTLTKNSVISELAGVLTANERKHGGEFYTQPATGGVVASGDVIIEQW